MVAVNRKFLCLEGGRYKVRDSQADEVIFSILKVGGTGGKNLSIATGKWDFDAAKLSNIVAGAATGEAVEYDQLNTALALYVPLSQKGANSGVATLDANGKVPSAQIPSIALVDVNVVADNTARDALTVQEGDVAIVTGSGITYIYDGSAWQTITAAGAVTSVNGQSGTVSLVTDDIAEDGSPVNLWHTTARARAAAVQTGAITDGVTTHAPTHDAVFDALALKADAATVAAIYDLSGTWDNKEGAEITARQVVYATAAGEVQLAQANDTLAPHTILRMVKSATVADDANTGEYWKPGARVPGFTGLTALGPVYLSRSAAGGYAQDLTGFVAGEHVILLGTATTTTEIEFNPKYLAEF